MMPRPRFPMQTRMPPHHFNPYQGPPFRSMMGMHPQMQQRGGILSRLLGKGAQSGGVPTRGLFGAVGPEQAAGGGSFLKGLTNPSSLNSMLSNTQKLLNTAQQVGPLVQQYGPVVKNLPALWKLYRGLKDTPDISDTSEAVPEESSSSSTEIQAFDLEEKETTQPKSTGPLPSIPKLYI